MYPSLSPYQYAANNPVIFVDAHGDSIVHINIEQQKEMMEQMSKQDRRQYEEYVKSKIVYEFADVLRGWQIITEARKYVDELKYEIGGQNLEVSVDCSGFVWAVIEKLGYVGERFTTGTFLQTGNFEEVKNAIWGDIFLGRKHMGFYDPVPIMKPPEKGTTNGNYLSARTIYGKVHYGKVNWYSPSKLYRIR